MSFSHMVVDGPPFVLSADRGGAGHGTLRDLEKQILVWS